MIDFMLRNAVKLAPFPRTTLKTGVKECKQKCKRRVLLAQRKIKKPFFTPKTRKKRQNTEGVCFHQYFQKKPYETTSQGFLSFYFIDLMLIIQPQHMKNGVFSEKTNDSRCFQ